MAESCPHAAAHYDVCDQAFAVTCDDCNTWLAFEWMDEHISDEWLRRLDPSEFFDMDHVACGEEHCIIERIRRARVDGE